MTTRVARTRVQFPAYRFHEQARIAMNDAMMALLVGVGIGVRTLSQYEGSSDVLPVLFPDIENVNRLNRRVDDAIDLLRASERHLASMAIPFALAVHQDYAHAVVRLIASHKGGSTEDTGVPPLDLIHKVLEESAGGSLSTRELEQFDFARRIRNRIMHGGGTAGSHLRTCFYQTMSEDARRSWIERSGRDPIVESGEPIGLLSGELFAVLATVKALGDEINLLVQRALGRQQWAAVAFEDWRSRKHQRHKPNRLRSLRGYARMYYGALDLSDDELAAAMEQATDQEERSAI